MTLEIDMLNEENGRLRRAIAAWKAECKRLKSLTLPAQPAQEPVTHTINSTHTAAVATDYYWIPIDANTPRGVKLQLLGQGGVAQYSNYHGDPFWSHWAPLPKRGD